MVALILLRSQVVVLGILTSTFAVPPSISMSPELWYQQALAEPALWHGGWLERERSVLFQFESLPHPDDAHTRSAGAWVTDHYLALLRSAVDVWDYTAWNADVLFERTGILAEYAPLVPDPAVLDWPAAEPAPDASGAHHSATKLDLYSRDPGALPPGTRPHLLLWGAFCSSTFSSLPFAVDSSSQPRRLRRLDPQERSLTTETRLCTLC